MTDEATREIRAQMRRALAENMTLVSTTHEFMLKDAPEITVGYGDERFVQRTTRAVVTQRVDDTFKIALHGPRVTPNHIQEARLTVTHEDTNAPIWVLGLLDVPVTQEEREALETKVFDILDDVLDDIQDQDAEAGIEDIPTRDLSTRIVEQIVREGWVPWKRG